MVDKLKDFVSLYKNKKSLLQKKPSKEKEYFHYLAYHLKQNENKNNTHTHLTAEA